MRSVSKCCSITAQPSTEGALVSVVGLCSRKLFVRFVSSHSARFSHNSPFQLLQLVHSPTRSQYVAHPSPQLQQLPHLAPPPADLAFLGVPLAGVNSHRRPSGLPRWARHDQNSTGEERACPAVVVVALFADVPLVSHSSPLQTAWPVPASTIRFPSVFQRDNTQQRLRKRRRPFRRAVLSSLRARATQMRPTLEGGGRPRRTPACSTASLRRSTRRGPFPTYAYPRFLLSLEAS